MKRILKINAITIYGRPAVRKRKGRGLVEFLRVKSGLLRSPVYYESYEKKNYIAKS